METDNKTVLEFLIRGRIDDYGIMLMRNRYELDRSRRLEKDAIEFLVREREKQESLEKENAVLEGVIKAMKAALGEAENGS